MNNYNLETNDRMEIKAIKNKVLELENIYIYIKQTSGWAQK